MSGQQLIDEPTTKHGGGLLMPRAWPLERILFALAGTMTLVAAFLAALVSPWFLLLAAFVGVNQWLYVAVGACPASVVLARVTRRDAAGCR
jgi:Zn-dependent protease